MKNALIILILIVAVIGCDKNNQPDLGNECYEKTTVYNSSNEILDWCISYFSNGNEIKYETRSGIWWEQKFDNKGNRVLFTSGDSKVEYEYNSLNQEVKAKYYTNNHLDFFYSNIYKDTLIEKSYTIYNANDTTGWQFYFYNSDNKKDSINCEDRNIYYYYSSEMDSVITKSKENSIMSRIFFKYREGKKSYVESRCYDYLGQENNHFIYTWEYNDNKLLIRQTEFRSYDSGETQWSDIRKVYDNDQKISRIEYYDESNNLTTYSKYVYENEILIKIEDFDINDNLKSYSILENTCNE
jgi:hypothetical protein